MSKCIALYGLDNSFQGYVTSVSVRNDILKSNMNKKFAKTYAKQETAELEMQRIDKISRGCLRCVLL